MNATWEQRLIELETRVAFMDNTVQSLVASVTAQDRLSGELRREFERLRQELKGITLSFGHDVRDEPPPPHY